MTVTVELIPLAEGNRITVNENEKVIIGRGSSLGCNEKKISRHHAELLLKSDHKLWIKPTHANPVFYRPSNGKIIQLAKDVERELKDGDQIGLLPSTFYFRISFSKDINNNHESDTDSDSVASIPDRSSPIVHRRSIDKNENSVFDFDDEAAPTPEKKTPNKRISLERKSSKPKSPSPVSSPSSSVDRMSISRSTSAITTADVQIKPKPTDSASRPRKLPKWMISPSASAAIKTTPSSSSVTKTSISTTPTSAKRQLDFDGDSNDASNLSDVRSPSTPAETKSSGKVLSRISSMKSFDSDSGDASESQVTRTPPPPKKIKPGSGKRRPVCQFGASCYRKNPLHRTEQSHPGDSDYEEMKANMDLNSFDDDDTEKPECPFGKACYRQNPQHKRDFKH